MLSPTNGQKTMDQLTPIEAFNCAKNAASVWEELAPRCQVKVERIQNTLHPGFTREDAARQLVQILSNKAYPLHRFAFLLGFMKATLDEGFWTKDFFTVECLNSSPVD